ncbi:MAG: hypothetical protein HZA05_05510 [Nitrospirae bacterium]|nr:hypothetical protein [Nitrospirota bacterium]
MRRIVLLCLMASFILGISSDVFSKAVVGGVIYKRNGAVIKTKKFTKTLEPSEAVSGDYKENNIKIKISDIKEVQLLTSDVAYTFDHSKLVKKSGDLVIIKRDGKQYTLKNAYFSTSHFGYEFFDEINNRVSENMVAFSEISRIIFGEDVGTAKKCPKDGRIFPSDYIYCPYDKTELISVKPE